MSDVPVGVSLVAAAVDLVLVGSRDRGVMRGKDLLRDCWYY